jgi:hypothetical protein
MTTLEELMSVAAKLPDEEVCRLTRIAKRAENNINVVRSMQAQSENKKGCHQYAHTSP